MSRAAILMWMVVIVAGCAATLPAVPGKGGPAWYELTSEHFSVWTDAELERARELIAEMERLREVIVGVAFPSAPSSRIVAIIVRNDEELRIVRADDRGIPLVRTASSVLYQPVICFSAFSNVNVTDVALNNQLSRVIASAVLARQPRWFTLGFATYFQTLNVDLGNTRIYVGNPPRTGTLPMRMAALMPVSRLLLWGVVDEAKFDLQVYSTAWALFTFLINEHRGELLHYIDLLHVPAAAASDHDPSQAMRDWAAAFPSLPIDRVDQELRGWLVKGKHLVVYYDLHEPAAPHTERALSDAEVHAIEGYLSTADSQEREHVAASLALDPTNVLARVLDVSHRKHLPSVAEASATSAAHPDDWRAWWLEVLARRATRTDDPAIATAAARACTLIALNPALRPPADLCAARDAQARSA